MIEGYCYFCEYPCEEDDYCNGCEEFICADCIGVSAEDLFGQHIPEDHMLDDEDKDW